MGSRWVRIALVVITLGLALLWSGSIGVIQATGEYLWPTTVQLMPLPADCVPSNEAPSPEALRIVQYEKSFYQLALQEMVVCRTPRKLPNIEPDFTEQVFDQSTRRKWLPLYVGCCSYKYGRHVAIIIAQRDERGSLHFTSCSDPEPSRVLAVQLDEDREALVPASGSMSVIGISRQLAQMAAYS